MEGKLLGLVKPWGRIWEGVPFSIHWTRDDRFFTKLMSTHGLLNEVPDHSTYRKKDGEWATFKYVEYLSRHNNSNHWVDNVNNRRHDNIGLEQVWHTKWWTTRQFTFICSVVKANAVYSKARGRKAIPEPQLEFCRKLALGMSENNLDDEGVSINSTIRRNKWSRGPGIPGYELVSRPTHTGMWNTGDNGGTKTKTEYVKIKCATCKTKIITYCNWNKKVPMCTQCYGVQISNCSNTN